MTSFCPRATSVSPLNRVRPTLPNYPGSGLLRALPVKDIGNAPRRPMPPRQVTIPPPPPMAGLQEFRSRPQLKIEAVEPGAYEPTTKWMNGAPSDPAARMSEQYRQELFGKLAKRRESQEQSEVVATGTSQGRGAAPLTRHKPRLLPKPVLEGNRKPVAVLSTAPKTTRAFTPGGPEKSKSLIEELEARFKICAQIQLQASKSESPERSV